MLVARDSRLRRQQWLQAYDKFLRATLAHTRYLYATGRLTDPESANDMAALEQEQLRLRLRLSRVNAEIEEDEKPLRLPQDPGDRLSFAARRELRSYREAVCADARRLRARSDALVRSARETRSRLRVVDGPR